MRFPVCGPQIVLSSKEPLCPTPPPLTPQTTSFISPGLASTRSRKRHNCSGDPLFASAQTMMARQPAVPSRASPALPFPSPRPRMLQTRRVGDPACRGSRTKSGNAVNREAKGIGREKLKKGFVPSGLPKTTSFKSPGLASTRSGTELFPERICGGGGGESNFQSDA